LGRGQLIDRMIQRGVTAQLDVILDALRIDQAAIRADDERLAREEGMIRIALLDIGRAALERVNDARRILRCDLFVE